jgi:hypothetical protein
MDILDRVGAVAPQAVLDAPFWQVLRDGRERRLRGGGDGRAAALAQRVGRPVDEGRGTGPPAPPRLAAPGGGPPPRELSAAPTR